LNNYLSILFIGDVVGEPGLRAVKNWLPDFKEKFKPDFIIINGENSAAGRGITEVESQLLFEAGANVITTGNHVWENWKSRGLLASNPNILRPFNYPGGNPGRGWIVSMAKDESPIAVVNIQGRTFMQPIDCPFKAIDYILSALVAKTKNIIVDIHAETTAEKLALAYYLDGRVSAVIGTHTHIQTADACILEKGTAYISDVGMTGPYDSVLGLRKDIAIKRFILQTPHKYEPAVNDPRIAGVHILINCETSMAVNIEPFIYPEYIRTRSEKVIDN
jgi:2',3'-cyclic-nucleotide 2'-phosphodiesterase